METPLLNQWFSGDQITAICWTLIHSLWIGLIIALLCGIVIAATRRSAAALRYRLLCGLLVLFVCAIGVTYYLESASVPASAGRVAHQAALLNVQHDTVVYSVAAPQHQTLLGSVQGFLNQNTSIIFLVWLLFFVLKSLKMVSGLLYIQRIRNYKTSDITEELKHRIEHLSGQIGIRRVVRLVQSELVKVPVAIGWLKPIILLPMGVAFQLTPEQLDGILWHELAHIRRRDYLVNILQGLVETVFFFNPGLLWLSSLIRTEREACCDDMVLSRMNRKANYLEALLSFGYGEFDQARYAMSIGSGNQLRDRLKRMISQENKKLSMAEKSVLAVGLVCLTAFTTISKDNPVIKHLTLKYSDKSGKMVTKSMAVFLDSLPPGRRVNDSKPGARVKDAINVGDTVVRFTSVLFKNSDADWANNDISAKDDKGNIYHFIVGDGKIVSMELNGVKIAESKLPDYEYDLQLIISELMDKRRVRNADVWKNTQRIARGNDSIAFKKRRYADMDSAKRSNGVYTKHYEPRPAGQVSVTSPDMRAEKYANMQRRAHEDSLSYLTQLKRMKAIIADLIHDKVIASEADVKWFGLSNTEFIVNGQKQPAEMQQRYKAKYGVREGYGLYYGPVQMTGTGFFIDLAATPRRQERPMHPERPMPRYMGDATPFAKDSIAWKQKQLINQQQLFASKEEAKRAFLTDQQQQFAIQEDKKRAQLINQQQQFAAREDEKRQQLYIKQQQVNVSIENDIREHIHQDHPFKPGIDLQTPITGIITDLVSENVISDKSELIKFNLTNSTLIVNGKKQPEDIHQKLKAKYLQQPGYKLSPGIADDPNFGLHFNAQNGAMGLGVTNGPDSP